MEKKYPIRDRFSTARREKCSRELGVRTFSHTPPQVSHELPAAGDYDTSAPSGIDSETLPPMPNYNRKSAKDYAADHDNTFTTNQASLALSQLHGDLLYPGIDTPFLRLLEESGITPTTLKGETGLPVDVLLDILLNLVPADLDDDQKKKLLRRNFKLVRLSAYEFLVSYCKAKVTEYDTTRPSDL